MYISLYLPLLSSDLMADNSYQRVTQQYQKIAGPRKVNSKASKL